MSRRAYTALLGAGSLGFAAWAFLRTDRLAELIGSDLDTARELAVRDLGSAVCLFGRAR